MLAEGKTQPLLGFPKFLPSPWSCQSGDSVCRSRCPCPGPCDVSCQWCRWPAQGFHPFRFPGHHLLPWEQKPIIWSKKRGSSPESLIHPEPPLHPPSLVTCGACCYAQLWRNGINKQLAWKPSHAYFLDAGINCLGLSLLIPSVPRRVFVWVSLFHLLHLSASNGPSQRMWKSGRMLHMDLCVVRACGSARAQWNWSRTSSLHWPTQDTIQSSQTWGSLKYWARTASFLSPLSPVFYSCLFFLKKNSHVGQGTAQCSSNWRGLWWLALGQARPWTPLRKSLLWASCVICVHRGAESVLQAGCERIMVWHNFSSLLFC